jgi:hypothetical protein
LNGKPVAQPQAFRDAHAAIVQEGAAPLRGGEQLVLGRVVDDAVRHGAAVLDADRDAVLRKAVDEIRGAVQRVDDPAEFVRVDGAGLLGEDRVVGVRLVDDVDDRGLGGLVDLGDEVVGALRAHHELRAVERGAVDDRAGAPRRFHRDV